MKSLKSHILSWILFLNYPLYALHTPIDQNIQKIVGAALEQDSQTLEQIDNLNQQDKQGNNAVMILVTMHEEPEFHGKIYHNNQVIDAIKLALRYGVNPSVANNQGYNLVSKVVMHDNHRNDQILEFMLQDKELNLLNNKIIDLEQKDLQGNTPLMLAAGHGNMFAVKKLLQAGADVNAYNSFGATALFIAKNRAIIDELRGYGAKDLHFKNNSLEKQFFMAAFDNNVNILEKELENNVDINMQNENGDTALSVAVQQGHLPAVTFLLKYGANPNTLNKQGNSPLLLANKLPLRKHAVDIIRILLAAQADILQTNPQGESICDIPENKEIQRILKTNCA